MEAVAAIVVGLVVLLFPGRAACLLALLVGASAFGAVVLNTYVDVGAVGPLPNLYEQPFGNGGGQLHGGNRSRRHWPPVAGGGGKPAGNQAQGRSWLARI